MDKIWRYINGILIQFRKCFSRDATFLWFLVVIVGLITRSDHLGVTSIIRELMLDPGKYKCLINFFRSSAWKLDEIRQKWIEIIKASGAICRIFGKPVLIGDGVKEPKEANRMPGVKNMRQESGNSAKSEFIRGHLFGGLGVLIGGAAKLFCLPLSMTIHDGNDVILQWKKSEYKDDSHVTRLVRESCIAAQAFGETCWLLLDRYFLTGPALTAIAEETAKVGKALVIMISLAKSNYTAWWKPSDPNSVVIGKNGKPKPAKAFTIMELFQTKADCFSESTLMIYGELKKVKYFCVNLIWNRDLKQEIRFVLVYLNGSKSILACTALDLDPRKIIELYCFRFKIETLFRAFKQVLAGFSCHFWTKEMPKFKPFIKAEEMASKVAAVTGDIARESIINTYDAIEGFVMFACIAIGLIQLSALFFSNNVNNNERFWKRTNSSCIPSEETTAKNLRYALPILFNKCHDLALARAIRCRRCNSHSRDIFNDDMSESA